MIMLQLIMLVVMANLFRFFSSNRFYLAMFASVIICPSAVIPLILMISGDFTYMLITISTLITVIPMLRYAKTGIRGHLYGKHIN